MPKCSHLTDSQHFVNIIVSNSLELGYCATFVNALKKERQVLNLHCIRFVRISTDFKALGFKIL